MAAVAAAPAELGASAGPSSAPVSDALATATATFTAALSELSSSLRQRWVSGELAFDDADSSITALVESTRSLKTELQKSLTFADETTTSSTWTTFREVAASQVRLQKSNALKGTVVLSEGDSLLVYSHLDAVTSLQEVDIVDGALALQIIEEVMERLTVDSACRVFGYLESRVSYLTRVSRCSYVIMSVRKLTCVLVLPTSAASGPFSFSRQRSRPASPAE
jgi:hypothetical protein